MNNEEIEQQKKDQPISIDEGGYYKLLEMQKLIIPADQIYREVAVNAIEAGIKKHAQDPNVKIDIHVGPDKEHLKETGISKFSITDNTIGMAGSKVVDYVSKLGKTGEQSKFGNHGMGTKPSAWANNPKGTVYQTWFPGESHGNLVWVYKNDLDRFATKSWKEANDSLCLPLSEDMMPEIIKKTRSGTKVRLMGSSLEQDTWHGTPPGWERTAMLKGKKKAKRFICFYNTRFYTIPEFITFKVEEDRGTSMTWIRGHKFYLDKYSEESGVMPLRHAKLHWYLMKDTIGDAKLKYSLAKYDIAVITGQLSEMQNQEVFKVAYGNANPLSSWGLPFSKGKVVLILEPDPGMFIQDEKRMSLYARSGKLSYPEWKEVWKDYFLQSENMPEAIRKEEERLSLLNSERDLDVEDMLKKMAKQFRNEFVLPHTDETGMDDQTLFGVNAARRPTSDETTSSPGNGTAIPTKGYGKNPLLAGIKMDDSKVRGNPGMFNPFPVIKKRTDLEKDWSIGIYQANNEYHFNLNCLLIDDYHSEICKDLPATRHAEAREKLIKRLCFLSAQQICYVRMCIGKTSSWSLEDKLKEALNPKALTAGVAAKGTICGEVKKQLQESARSADLSEGDERLLV